MQDQGIEQDDRLSDEAYQAGVLGLLLEEDHPLWTIDEIARDLDHRIGAIDACDRLHAAGLIHRCGDFVLATRAAARAHELPG